jgi:pterin-4a-carbinolamine dehydratase
MKSADRHSPELDPWEFQQLQKELRDWVFTGRHHMHKSWIFPTSQQALQWHALARSVAENHGRDCSFYLGHVGSGRIETDILNRVQGHLTRDDLDVAVMMNAIENQLKSPPDCPNSEYLSESVQFLHRARIHWSDRRQSDALD